MNGDVTIREVMTREYVGVSESDTVRDTAELMLEEGVEGAVVLRGREPVGLLTEQEVLAVVAGGLAPEETTVSEVMRTEPPTVTADAGLIEGIQTMSSWDARHLVVTNGDEVVGLFTEHDVVAISPTLLVEPANSSLGPGGSIEADAGGAETEPASAGEYSDQSICEACGSLSHELASINGQLLCPDCREV